MSIRVQIPSRPPRLRRMVRELCSMALLAFCFAPAAADVFGVAAAQGALYRARVAAATQDPPPAPPDDEVLESKGAVIGEVIVKAGDIFDPDQPGERNFLF